MGLVGILLALGLLMWLAYKGWSVLLLAPGAIVTLLAVCGTTHRESYFDIVMVAIVGAVLALAAVIVLGNAFGSF